VRRAMKPAPFTYAAPSTLEEAITLLGEYGDDVKLLAGGQSLMPMLNLRLARPQYIVDLNRIPGLEYVMERDGGLAVGALTRQRSLERAPSVLQRYPLVHEATTLIGHRAIRNRGTVGGSIAHADPAAELPAVLVAYGGSVQVQGPRSTRQIAAADFFRAYLTTALEPDEVLTEVRLPTPPSGTGWCFMEESRRHGDFAMAGVAVLLTLDRARQCTHVAVVLCGVGSVPHQVAAAPALLLGHPVDAVRLRDVAQAAASEIEPESDLHASAEFRRHLSTVLIQRALRQAAARVTL
jgi:aerobic carbon-monoxide dehydrogenase medium subunit